ncbi:IS110 family transposase [Pseudonocardia hierapolitana]|uniref:IS110 family transposase n=1 Tax=Pseudonocardia hierapolitana TaxID=1128676 RepID=UPI001FE87A8B|nr:IS110 family transposase [Pseudonocardia hierapolitana]
MAEASEEGVVLEEDPQVEEIIARVAALDIGKAEVVCCVRVPHEGKPGRRLQEVTTYSTMTRSLLGMADHLRCLGVTRVVMEATSDYWKPVFYLLEAQGFETWLVNARDVRHLPGRPKTDKLDSVWLCKVAERQMLRRSFVPPAEIRRLRDVARYRVDLIEARTAEKQRAEKLLEDAQIKLSVVASDIFGASGREMMAALIAGRRNPVELAEMAKARMRRKIPALIEAFHGHFTDHHGFLLGKMLARIDALNADIAELDAVIEELITPFVSAVERIDEITGFGPIAAAGVIAEIGMDMSRFPTPGHLASWAKYTPGVKQSAGRKKGRSPTGPGNRYLARILGEAAMTAGRTDTFLGERYRRLARRIGKQKAIVAVGRSMLVIIWHLLSDPKARYSDLGSDFYDKRINVERRRRNHIHQLEALGYKVTVEPAA